MSIEKQINKIISDTSFPNDRNVRLTITGLALCKLDFNTSLFRFLRHPKHHKLKLEVTRREKTGAIIETLLTYYVDSDENIDININSSESGLGIEYLQEPINIHKLNNMVNVANIHGTNLRDISNMQQTSLVNINKCQFYTALPTLSEYMVTLGKKVIIKDKQLGLILGGYGKFAGAGIEIKSSKLTENFPAKDDNGNDCYYEISFDNACVKKDECVTDAGVNETDFRYYYDVIEDSKNPKMQAKLFISKEAESTAEVGACLPVVEDPPFNG